MSILVCDFKNLLSTSMMSCVLLHFRVALTVEFVDGVTRLECMRKSDEFKVLHFGMSMNGSY